MRQEFYNDVKETTYHSYAYALDGSVYNANDTSKSVRMVSVEPTSMTVYFRSTVKKVPNVSNAHTAQCKEEFTASLQTNDQAWATTRTLDITRYSTISNPASDGAFWPNSGGGGSEFIPPFQFSGKVFQFYHFLNPAAFLNPGTPAFYAIRAFDDIPWNQEPFF